MAISMLDSCISYWTGGTTGTTISPNLSAGSNRMIFVYISGNSNNISATVTYNGTTPMTLIESSATGGGSGYDKALLYFLEDKYLITGTHDITISFTPTCSKSRIVYWSMQGVAQTSPNTHGIYNSQGNSGTAINIATVRDGAWEIFATSADGTLTPTWNIYTSISSQTDNVWSSFIGTYSTATATNLSSYIGIGVSIAIVELAITISPSDSVSGMSINGYTNSVASFNQQFIYGNYINNAIPKRTLIGVSAYRNGSLLGNSFFTTPNSHYFYDITSGSVGADSYPVYSKIFQLSGDSNIIGETGFGIGWASAPSRCQAGGIFAIQNAKEIEYTATPVLSASINVTTYTQSALVLIVAARSRYDEVTVNGNLLELYDVAYTGINDYDKLRLTAAFCIEPNPGVHTYSTTGNGAVITFGISFKAIPLALGNGISISPYMFF